MEQIAIIIQNMGSNYVATIFLLSSSLKANCFGSFYTLLDSRDQAWRKYLTAEPVVFFSTSTAF